MFLERTDISFLQNNDNSMSAFRSTAQFEGSIQNNLPSLLNYTVQVLGTGFRQQTRKTDPTLNLNLK